MSKTTKEIMSYIEQFIAMAKGDDAEALGLKVKRSAKSAIQTRLHNEEGNLYEIEEKVEKAEEKLIQARMNNFSQINDRKEFIENLITARNNVTKAKEALEDKKLLISVLQEELSILDK